MDPAPAPDAQPDAQPAGDFAVPRQTPRHQQLIVTIYGLYGRANGGRCLSRC